MTPTPCWIVISAYPSNPAQKCDAKRPCTTCTAAEDVSECVYDSEMRPESAGVYPVHRADCHSLGQHSGSALPAETPAVPSTRPPAKQNPTPSTSDATRTMTHRPSTVQTLEANQDQFPHVRSSELVRVHSNPPGRTFPDSQPPNSVISSFLLSKIPPQPQIPLSFLGGEKLQVQTSEIPATDLDMKWCVLQIGTLGHIFTFICQSVVVFVSAA